MDDPYGVVLEPLQFSLFSSPVSVLRFGFVVTFALRDCGLGEILLRQLARDEVRHMLDQVVPFLKAQL